VKFDVTRKARELPSRFESQIRLVDCLNLNLGTPSLPAKSVDHVITDPPYETHTHENRMATDNGGKPIDTPVTFAPMDDHARMIVAREMVRICKGWIIVFCEDAAIGRWQTLLIEAGAKRRTTMIWRKVKAPPKFMGNGPAQAFEAMVLCWAGEGQSVWNGGGKLGIYEYGPDEGPRRHETQKPLALMEQLILDFTMPGELIADPYMGGGSTCIAAKRLGRRYVGWEVDEAVFTKASLAIWEAKEQTRWEQFMHHERVRPTAFGDIKTKKPGQENLFDSET